MYCVGNWNHLDTVLMPFWVLENKAFKNVGLINLGNNNQHNSDSMVLKDLF